MSRIGNFLRGIFTGGRRQPTFGPGPQQTLGGTTVNLPTWPPQGGGMPGGNLPNFQLPQTTAPSASSMGASRPSPFSAVQQSFAPQNRMQQGPAIFDRPSYSPPPPSPFLGRTEDESSRSRGERAWDFFTDPNVAAGLAGGVFGTIEGRQNRRSQERQSRAALEQRAEEFRRDAELRGQQLSLEEARFRAEQEQLRRQNELEDQTQARRARVAQMLAPMFKDIVGRQASRPAP